MLFELRLHSEPFNPPAIPWEEEQILIDILDYVDKQGVVLQELSDAEFMLALFLYVWISLSLFINYWINQLIIYYYCNNYMFFNIS